MAQHSGTVAGPCAAAWTKNASQAGGFAFAGSGPPPGRHRPRRWPTSGDRSEGSPACSAPSACASTTRPGDAQGDGAERADRPNSGSGRAGPPRSRTSRLRAKKDLARRPTCVRATAGPRRSRGPVDGAAVGGDDLGGVRPWACGQVRLEHRDRLARQPPPRPSAAEAAHRSRPLTKDPTSMRPCRSRLPEESGLAPRVGRRATNQRRMVISVRRAQVRDFHFDFHDVRRS